MILIVERWLKIYVLFIASFLVVYLIICYFPSMRIKLAAEPMEYFVASIKHNMGFEILVSFVCGLLISFISIIFTKRAN